MIQWKQPNRAYIFTGILDNLVDPLNSKNMAEFFKAFMAEDQVCCQDILYAVVTVVWIFDRFGLKTPCLLGIPWWQRTMGPSVERQTSYALRTVTMTGKKIFYFPLNKFKKSFVLNKTACTMLWIISLGMDFCLQPMTSMNHTLLNLTKTSTSRLTAMTPSLLQWETLGIYLCRPGAMTTQ